MAEDGGAAAEDPGRAGGAGINEPLKSIRTCAVCGKEFIIHRGAGYLYKRMEPNTRATEYFCSWRCMRSAEETAKKMKAAYRPAETKGANRSK